MGRWGDGEMGRWGGGEMGLWEDGMVRRWEDGKMGRWEDRKMGKWHDRKTRRGEMGSQMPHFSGCFCIVTSIPMIFSYSSSTSRWTSASRYPNFSAK